MKKTACFLLIVYLFIFNVSASTIICQSEVNLAASDPEYFGSTEMPLGLLTADALRTQTGAYIAIVCSGELGANLPAGDITVDVLAESLPLNPEIYTAAISVTQLCELLEALLSHIVTDDSEHIDWEASQFEGFPQISGFQLTFDASNPVGSRITDLTVDINPDNTDSLVIAASLDLLAGSYGGELPPEVFASLSYAGTQRELVGTYLSELGTITQTSAPSTGRISIIGARQNTLINGIPLGIIVLAIVLFAIGRSGRFKKAFDGER